MRTSLPQQDLALEGMRDHRFGLSPKAWQRFRGLAALVTGAGTGYGQAIATALAGAGANVILVGRRREKLEETAEKCRENSEPSVDTLVCPTDLCDFNSQLTMLDWVEREMNHPALLVNSAALPCARDIAKPVPLFSYGVEEWEKLMRTNVTAPWFLSREFIARFHDSNPIRIVNMTSRAGWSAKGSVGPYNVSKAALNNLTMSLAEEARMQFPGADIQINALNPWEARTEMNQGSTAKPEEVLPMTLLLLAQPAGGPSGYFFCRDGRHDQFTDTLPYGKDLAAESR
ncbi:SDR family oxidoreductase [Hwanghaeella grinnelliae]|uniref:SDR family oxidoreductase n=1 Tax=Hwanghaeella grinnelliae TaxID=2500179 RepID=A0A3S2ZCW8_9PROT|nr:SDR family oxidoreductase [Hwanghaeella grinnelliae]RVU39613.1 SDR family oxidoreductase [Hwanghaeella grinnelliae]